jgi:hypothetical protein
VGGRAGSQARARSVASHLPKLREVIGQSRGARLQNLRDSRRRGASIKGPGRLRAADAAGCDHLFRRGLGRGPLFGSRSSAVGGLAGGGGAGAIGPNLRRIPRKVWMRGDNG